MATPWILKQAKEPSCRLIFSQRVRSSSEFEMNSAASVLFPRVSIPGSLLDTTLFFASMSSGSPSLSSKGGRSAPHGPPTHPPLSDARDGIFLRSPPATNRPIHNRCPVPSSYPPRWSPHVRYVRGRVCFERSVFYAFNIPDHCCKKPSGQRGSRIHRPHRPGTWSMS